MKKSWCFLLFFCISSVLHIYAQSSWIEKKSDLGKFYINFPSYPTYSSNPFHGWGAKDKNGQVTYTLAYIVAPPNEELSIAVVEKFLLPSMLKGDIEVSKKYLMYNGFDAIDFLYRSKQNPVLYKKGRVIVRERKLYVLQVYYYHSDLQDFNKFSSSLVFY